MAQYLVKIKNHRLNKQVVAKVVASSEAEAREIVCVEASYRLCSFANPYNYNKAWPKWDAWHKENLPKFSGTYWKDAEYIVVELHTNIISLEWDSL